MPFEDARVKLSNDADAMAEIVSDAACDQTFIAWFDQTVAKAWRGGLSGALSRHSTYATRWTIPPDAH